MPATLLHIGFLSVDLSDEELRGAAFELLAAVCDYLKYDKNPIVAPSGSLQSCSFYRQLQLIFLL